jgi:Mg/Co/Ni transporter MgtE
LLLGQLVERFREEGFTMSYTMEDFKRQYVKEHFARLTPEEQREALERLSPEHRREVLRSLPAQEQEEMVRSLPPEQRLAGLSEEEIRQYLNRLHEDRSVGPRRSRRKK